MERKVAAILSADVAGYSRLVEAFEQETHDRLRTLRERVVNPAVTKYNGEVIKRTGDGLLAIFTTSESAVGFAVAVQNGFRRHQNGIPPERAILFRIGISHGEVLLEAEDVFGNHVNVAARLQELAEKGGVLISDAVRERLSPGFAPQLLDLGPQALKNMSRPVVAYRVVFPNSSVAARMPAVPIERPSIAVLPFRALQSAPELQYFGDGFVEDIIAALASLRELMVIARNSTLRFRDGSSNIRDVGNDLGVRYILTGSIRQSEKRLRISTELSDAAKEVVVWAQHYDLGTEALFEVQDKITGVIVNTIAPQIQAAEVRRVLQKRPESMNAYDFFLQGLSLMYRLRQDEFSQAGSLIRRAIALDDSYAAAYALASEWHLFRIGQGWSPDPIADANEAIRFAEASIERDGNNALALAVLGHCRSYVFKQYDEAKTLFDRALYAHPGHARAWGLSAPTFNYIGEPEAALSRAQQALTLSPYDPFAFWYKTSICVAHYTQGDYEAAIHSGRSAIAENPQNTPIWRTMAAAFAAAGRKEQARAAAQRVLELDPEFKAGLYAQWYPYRDAERKHLLGRHLVESGLPP